MNHGSLSACEQTLIAAAILCRGSQEAQIAQTASDNSRSTYSAYACLACSVQAANVYRQ
jgi:hypothetical protein